MFRFSWIALPLLASPACKLDRPFDEALEIDAPIATRSHVVYVDHGRKQLIFVDPGESKLGVAMLPMGDDNEKILRAFASRDRISLLVLTGPATDKDEDVQEVLHRIDGGGTEEVETYPVEAPFNAAALTPDHTTAVLYFDGDAGTHLQNANQVSIVDLTSDRVNNLTLNGFGGRLSAVQFPGQITEGEPALVHIGDADRDLAAFLAQDEVILVDMDSPETDQVAVRFDEDVNFLPESTLLRPEDTLWPDPTLFVRPTGGSDVAMLVLHDKQDEETQEAGFTAQVSLLPAPGTTDFVFLNDGPQPGAEATFAYLVSIHGNSNAEVLFTDIGTQEGFGVAIDGSATQLFLREHESGDDTIPQIVAWGYGGGYVHTLEVDNIASSLGQEVNHLKIETGIDDLVRLDNDRLLIGSGTILYVVNVQEEQVTPLTSQVPYDPKNSALEGERLLLGTPGQDWISSADLTVLNPESMVLDDTIATFSYLSDAGKIVLTHDSMVGHMTVVDSTEPKRSTSYVSWGFLLEGALDAE